MAHRRKALYFHGPSLVGALGTLTGLVVGIATTAVCSSDPLGNTAVIALIVSLIGSFLVYYLSLPRGTITSRAQIEAILLAAGLSLGPSYRLSVMRPSNHKDVAEQFFIFLAHFRMKDLHNYDGKIKFSTKGVGHAYNEKTLVVLAPAEVDPAIDSYPKYIWSKRIECKPACIINIDTNEQTLDQQQVAHVSSVITELAKQLVKYSPVRLEPIG